MRSDPSAGIAAKKLGFKSKAPAQQLSILRVPLAHPVPSPEPEQAEARAAPKSAAKATQAK
jgi:hypothetical protein